MSKGVQLARQRMALAPLWQWRGARPQLLDLDEDQAGSLVCLVFVREGDCCLMPLAWRYEQVGPEPQDPWQATLPFAQDGLDAETMRLARRSLEADGWRVSGRLDMHFEGRDAAVRFWEQVEGFLCR